MTDPFIVPSIPAGTLIEIGKRVSKESKKIRINFQAGFQKYYAALHKKHSVYRTILKLSEDIDLISTYQDMRYREQKKESTGHQIWLNMLPGDRYLIQGTGGSGKSLFSKMATLWTIMSPSNRFVLYLDLKTINQNPNQSIEFLIFKELSPLMKGLDVESLNYLLAEIDFLAIFDGFDEIVDTARSETLVKINHFGTKHPKATIVVTSRPHDNEAAWTGFRILTIQPLSQTESKGLIEKLPYDEKIREKVLDDFDAKIWPNYSSFAENPLLCTLMVVVYARDGFLAQNLADFYQQAFDAVLLQHDRAKDFYERQFNSGLQPSQLEGLFAAFCFQSYIDGKHAFKRGEAISLVKKANKFQNLEVDPHSAISDFVECICVLIKDGLDYKFSHRSFQEYFAAKFAVEANFDTKKICDRFFQSRMDISLPLYYALNTDRVVQEWFLPYYNILKKWTIVEASALIDAFVIHESGGYTIFLKDVSIVEAINVHACLNITGGVNTFPRHAGAVGYFMERLPSLSYKVMTEEKAGVASVKSILDETKIPYTFDAEARQFRILFTDYQKHDKRDSDLVVKSAFNKISELSAAFDSDVERQNNRLKMSDFY